MTPSLGQSILVAAFFYMIMQFGYLWRNNAEMLDVQSRLTDNLADRDAEIADLRQTMRDRDRDIHRMERRIKECGSLSTKRQSNVTRIFVVTPTHSRLTQEADLTRLSHTLMHVPNIVWIVVEDADDKSEMVADILKRSSLQSGHTFARTPADLQLADDEPRWRQPRGVEQRNAGLNWIRRNYMPTDGVVYFADDDNTYDLRLFDEIRKVRTVGVWPVGIVGGQLIESPIVSPGGLVTGFNSKWKPDRPYPLDMASFAVHTHLLAAHPRAAFNNTRRIGYVESSLFASLSVKLPTDLVPLADRCTKVYVWHTRTERPKVD